jgi:hypothetical protein
MRADKPDGFALRPGIRFLLALPGEYAALFASCKDLRLPNGTWTPEREKTEERIFSEREEENGVRKGNEKRGAGEKARGKCGEMK